MADAAGGANVPPEEKKNEPKPEASKKGKTPAQIERERMRRRRRRQRKRIMKSLGTVELSAAEKSLVPEKPVAGKLREELPRRAEEAHPRPSLPRGVEKPERAVATPKVRPEVPPKVSPEEKVPAGELPAQPTEEEPAIEETGLTYLAHPFAEEEPEHPEQAAQPEELAQTEEPVPTGPAPGEEIIIGPEEEKPEVIPVGKLREEAPVEEETQAEVQEEEAPAPEPQKEEAPEAAAKAETPAKVEELSEKKSVYLAIGATLLAALKKAPASLGVLGGIFGKIFSVLKLKIFVPFLVLAVIGGIGFFGFTQGWHEQAVRFVTGFFTPKPQEKITVTINQQELKAWGILTADIFAHNNGSVFDRVPVQISMADFFGRLQEPRVAGETGISAATFYGELKDGARVINEFVEYMSNLERLQGLYKIDVYALLDRSPDRDGTLNTHLEQLKKAQTDSGRILAGIRLNIDDFTVSFESLSPDKSRYETDFFAAMEDLQPQKSDMLLKGFIDISQKQTALKARINALTKLAGYYETALKRLEKRIQAVDQNRAALVQGIRVVDIPGADLNIIIRPGN